MGSLVLTPESVEPLARRQEKKKEGGDLGAHINTTNMTLKCSPKVDNKKWRKNRQGESKWHNPLVSASGKMINRARRNIVIDLWWATIKCEQRPKPMGKVVTNIST